jgi:hypothetical protein
MGVPLKRRLLLAAVCLISLAAVRTSADEIRLKDGKKVYGVIVGYEENMFKVKTDFGFVLVEKDKIASIIPSAPAASDTQTTAKPGADPAKGVASAQPSAVPSPTNASSKAAIKVDKTDKPAAINSAVKPELPAKTASSDPVPPAIKGSAAPANATLASASAQPGPPKEPDVPAIREEVQGNLYTNYTHGFRMYKAPSWQPIDDARNALPNAIVAMGTSNESTLLIVGREKTKETLEPAAATVEKRLHEVYENYHLASQRKTTVGGSPAVEFHYLGKADDHDWSGTLVVLSRSGDIFTILGMTYADSDLIQIQENVIAKAIASLSFDVHEAKK